MKKRQPTSFPRRRPFALNGHVWWPNWFVDESRNDGARLDIIRAVGPWSLIRRGAGTVVEASTSEPADKIAHWTKERYLDQTKEFFESDRHHIANLLVASRNRNDAVRCLEAKAEAIIRGLVRLANDGNDKAACAIARLVGKTCRQMNDLAITRPKLFAEMSRQCLRWPMMRSPHPYLRDDEAKLFAQLGIGKGLPIEIHRTAKWIPDTATEIAYSLLQFIRFARSEFRDPGTDYGRLASIADKLPPFNDETAKDWWELAKSLLLFSYPKPEEITELAELVTAKSKRKSPGRLKQAILDLLQSRFVGFARPDLPDLTR